MKHLKGKSILRDEIVRAKNAIVKFDESIRLRDRFFTDETFYGRNAHDLSCRKYIYGEIGEGGQVKVRCLHEELLASALGSVHHQESMNALRENILLSFTSLVMDELKACPDRFNETTPYDESPDTQMRIAPRDQPLYDALPNIVIVNALVRGGTNNER